MRLLWIVALGASREDFDRDARVCIDVSNDMRASAASARYSSRQNALLCCWSDGTTVTSRMRPASMTRIIT